MKDIQEKNIFSVNGWVMVVVDLVSETEMHPIVTTGTPYS